MDISSEINHTSSFEEMIRFLEARNGIDLLTFDQGEKTLEDLYDEICQRDVVLRPNQEDNRAERCAMSVRIDVFDPVRRLNWSEVYRRFSKNRRIIPSHRTYAIRETRKRIETFEEARERALLEERNFRFMPEVDRYEPLATFADVERYESTVYRGIRTVNSYTAAQLVTERFATQREINRGLIVITDRGGVNDNQRPDKWSKSYVQAFPLAA